MSSLYNEQGRPSLPLGMKWASNEPFNIVPIDAVEEVGNGWTRQRHMAYRTNPEAPGSKAQPHVYYAYANESLHPGMVFWACYGLGAREFALSAGLIVVTVGMVWYSGKAKPRRRK